MQTLRAPRCLLSRQGRAVMMSKVRDRERLRRDLQEGKISAWTAKHVYRLEAE